MTAQTTPSALLVSQVYGITSPHTRLVFRQLRQHPYGWCTATSPGRQEDQLSLAQRPGPRPRLALRRRDRQELDSAFLQRSAQGFSPQEGQVSPFEAGVDNRKLTMLFK